MDASRFPDGNSSGHYHKRKLVQIGRAVHMMLGQSSQSICELTNLKTNEATIQRGEVRDAGSPFLGDALVWDNRLLGDALIPVGTTPPRSPMERITNTRYSPQAYQLRAN